MSGRVRAADESGAAGSPFVHPPEVAAEARLATLSRLARMERSALDPVAVARGRRTLPRQAHAAGEEWE